MWEYNKSHQSPIVKHSAEASQDLDLKDPEVFEKCLGKDEHYADFLQFFKNEIAEKGVSRVVKEYLLKGDERANDILGRMFTGEWKLLQRDFRFE